MEEILKNHKVIVCAGSGGVGKTTIAASLGVYAAQLGLNVLVLTIDPAKRLAAAMGLAMGEEEEVLVPGQNFPGKLYAGIIDPQDAFSRFVRRAMKDSQRLEKLVENPLYQQLSTTLSGSQEFTSLVRHYQAVEKGDHDLIILDTPPAQHARDFLQAPQRIYALFQKSITRWFLDSQDQTSFVSRVINRGTQAVLLALEKVTGSEFISKLSEFFQSVQSIQDKISSQSLKVHELLTSPSTGFVLITGFDQSKLNEAKSFYAELAEAGYSLLAVIVNRSFPLWLKQGHTHLTSHPEAESYEKLDRVYQQMSEYYNRRQMHYEEFQKQFAGSLPVVRIPEIDHDIHGLDSLIEMSSQLQQRLFTEGAEK